MQNRESIRTFSKFSLKGYIRKVEFLKKLENFCAKLGNTAKKAAYISLPQVINSAIEMCNADQCHAVGKPIGEDNEGLR